MRILFAASESVPFAASGGLADVIGSLPRTITQSGHDCRVVIPLYDEISEEFRSEMQFIKNITVDVAWRKQYCGIFTVKHNGMIYYFIDNEYYFKREGLYGHHDDGERFVFFSRAVMEMLKVIDFKPEIINANDWQTALIPVYHQIFYRYQQGYDKIKVVFTIHNVQYQGQFGKETLRDLIGIPMYHTGFLEFDGQINLMKAAIETADYITTVSPSYAWEVLDPWHSYGMDRILVTKQHKFKGILNGVDVDAYNPESDINIPCNYSAEDISGKTRCKKDLLSLTGFSDDDGPVIGIVTRLVQHKGIDLVKHVFDGIIELGYRLIILGSGEEIYENFFIEMQNRFPDKVSVTLGFNHTLSKQIYAGVDMFLMPSQNEPCGLAQLMSMRYGTVPIVRETGGLRDTVADNSKGNGSGYTFKNYNANDMLECLKRARLDYDDKKIWQDLVKRIMTLDFSWNTSANAYIELYQSLV